MDTERRSMHDRRSVRDRRKLAFLKRFFIKAEGRKEERERRRALERRWGWVRLSKWSSVHLASLKLSKFIGVDKGQRPPE